MPLISGHAPGHLREEFADLVENLFCEPKPSQEHIQMITGKLWNCTDILPGDYCADLDIQRGSTYAQAARKIRKSADLSLR